MMTRRSDRHYVEYLAGFCLNYTVKIGGGSTGGKVYNFHTNWYTVTSGHEGKFGEWANSPGDNTALREAFEKYAQENTVVLLLGHVEDQFLFSNFSFAGYIGVKFVLENGRGASGWCVGHGVDYGTKALVFEGVGDMQFINTQLVSFGRDWLETDYLTHLMTTSDFTGTATFYNVAFWGSSDNTLVLHGGRFNMYNAVTANVPSIVGGNPNVVTDIRPGVRAHMVNWCLENDNNSKLAGDGSNITADALFFKSALDLSGATGIHHVRRGQVR
jgi:hypothetical protein